MSTAETLIPRPPAACWREFTDAARLIAWVPGLRRARVVAALPDGLPLEVAFEFAGSRTYTLVYQYEPATHTVRWSPRTGQRDAVRGSIELTPVEGGTLARYHLEPALPDSPAADNPAAVLAAFAAWMDRTRP